MGRLSEGDRAPKFCLDDHEGKTHCLDDFKGKWVILYFYPKDMTSGCTREAQEFTELLKEFEKLNAVVIGISKDPKKSHKKFIDKYGLKVLLLSDEDHRVIEAYGAWVKKKMAGREYMGTMRSTFIIDDTGTIRKVYYNVKAKGHAEKVLEDLKELRSR